MAFDPTQFALGWNPDAEPQHAGEFAKLACAAAPVTEPLPDEISYPEVQVKNQGPIGSCQGHELTTILETDHLIDTGVYVELSPRFGYLATKQTDGSLGQGDSGSTISGGAVTASRVGCCTVKTAPYWDAAYLQRYSEAMAQGRPIPLDETIQQAWLDEAKLHLLRSQCDIPDWDSGERFIGTRQGGMGFGINWYESLANLDIGPDEVVTGVSGGVLGGHALCVIEYVTKGGQRIPRVRNSHGKRWNGGGTMLIDPDLLFKLIRQARFGAKGMSGLQAFATRKFKHRDGGYV